MAVNILKEKSFYFSLNVIKLYKLISESKKEYVLSKQLLRSGTGIGALIREANNAESKPDFIHKLGMAQKECDESLHWLELLAESDFLTKEQFSKAYQACTEILKIIRISILTTKQNLNKSY